MNNGDLFKFIIIVSTLLIMAIDNFQTKHFVYLFIMVIIIGGFMKENENK